MISQDDPFRSPPRPLAFGAGFQGQGIPRGFTLMELLVVLILASLTAGLVIPRVGAGWSRLEERDFLQDYVNTIKRARLRAMSSGKTTAFRINGSQRTYGMESPPEKPIPETVDIYADDLDTDPETGDFLVRFHPDGSHSASGEMEVVFNKERFYAVSIHPLFGNVEWSAKGEAG